MTTPNSRELVEEKVLLFQGNSDGVVSNKVWIGRLEKDATDCYYFTAQWGRIGAALQPKEPKLYGFSRYRWDVKYETKVREKTAEGYRVASRQEYEAAQALHAAIGCRNRLLYWWASLRGPVGNAKQLEVVSSMSDLEQDENPALLIIADDGKSEPEAYVFLSDGVYTGEIYRNPFRDGSRVPSVKIRKRLPDEGLSDTMPGKVFAALAQAKVL